MVRLKDLMLDLECFGSGRFKAVVQIGACYFDRLTGEIGKTLSINIDAQSCTEKGFMMSGGPVYFWLSQPKETIECITRPPLIDIKAAMIQFNEFASEAKNIWSHATYDFVTIMDAFDLLQIKPSFGYKTARDIRTAVDLGRVRVSDTVRDGIHHDALSDCRHQVKYLVEALNNIIKLKALNKIINNNL